MAINDPAPLLPVTRLEANSRTTCDVGTMILLPSDTYYDLMCLLAHMAQVSINEVTVFLQRATTKEIVRITSDMDLMLERPVGLVVLVGHCSVCEKEEDGVPVEFHPCPLNEAIEAAGFRLLVGPIQRSAMKETVCDEDLRKEQPVGLVGLCGCAVCDKERDGSPVEFHPCPFDKIIDFKGFTSPVGPIQRPPRGIVA